MQISGAMHILRQEENQQVHGKFHQAAGFLPTSSQPDIARPSALNLLSTNSQPDTPHPSALDQPSPDLLRTSIRPLDGPVGKFN